MSDTIVAPTEREVTAYHEAGHVVLYWLRRLPIRYVTLHPARRGAIGLTAVHRPRPTKAWDLAAIAAAGLAAEAVYCEATDPYRDDEDERDDYLVAALLHNRHGDTATVDECAEVMPWATVDGILADARMEVEREWPKVEAVAGVLLRSPRRVSGRHLFDLLDEMEEER